MEQGQQCANSRMRDRCAGCVGRPIFGRVCHRLSVKEAGPFWAPAMLAAAIVASVALNSLLVATFVGSDLITPWLRIILWGLLAAAWTAGVGYSFWFDRCDQARRKSPVGNLFECALDEYLKGNWFEAERGLYRLLRDNDHDLEARLLLATLFRHTKRFDEATRQLNLLARLAGAYRWSLEIPRAGQLLADARRDKITAEDDGREDAAMIAANELEEASGIDEQEPLGNRHRSRFGNVRRNSVGPQITDKIIGPIALRTEKQEAAFI